MPAAGIRTHTPVRRVASRGGCDLCGSPIDDDVHEGDLVEAEGGNELERLVATSDFFARHRDGSLCSMDDCKRKHLHDDDGE